MKLLRRLHYWIHRREEEAALAEEMEQHRAMLRQAGEAPASFGNGTGAMEDSRGVWIWPWLESVIQDARYALRGLRRQPSFTLAAILAITLGLGLNSSLFTAFNAVALQPWPVKAPERVVTIYNLMPRQFFDSRYGGFSVTEGRFLGESARTLEGVVVYRPMGARIGFEPAGESSKACFVTGNFFSVLGIGMALGRGFIAEEDISGRPEPVVILSHRIWRNRFGSDPAIVGKQVRIDEVPLTVVGVVSEEFQGVDLMQNDIWLPMTGLELLRTGDEGRRWAQSFLYKPDHCCSGMAARLAPGATREAARVELDALHRRYGEQHRIETAGVMVRGTENLGVPGAMRALPVIGLFSVATLLILLLACANVGNLLLARGAARGRELAMRRSLGATRGRLIRQLLTESMILAGTSGILAVLMAAIMPDMLVRWAVGEPPMRIKPDQSVLVFTGVLALLAGIAFGLVPALRSTRDLASAARSRLSLRGGLLTVQVAISVILLVNAGMLLRAVSRAQAENPGFAVENRTVVALQFPANSYNAERRTSVAARIADDIQRVPHVRRAALSTFAPLGRSLDWTNYRLPNEPADAHHEVRAHGITPGYTGVLRTPVVAGRDLEPADAARDVILVNQTLANQAWPKTSAVGKTMITGKQVREVVGVVADAYLDGWKQIPPAIFGTFKAGNVAYLLLETDGRASIEVLREAIRQTDSRVQLEFYPLSDNIERQLKPIRAGAQVASMLGMLGLMLASIGIFGVFSYVVEQKTREIGVRMAVGASPAQVVRGVLGGSGIALLTGAIFGVAGAIPIARVLEGEFVSVRRFDAPAYLAVLALLGVAGIVASYLPARRASRVHPMDALRVD